MEFHEAVTDFAYNQIGEQELKGNQGFKSDRFLELMQSTGWQVGEAWCSYFAELCWTHPSYRGKYKYLSKMIELFSGSAVQTFNNFKNDKSGLFEVLDYPRTGAVVVWQTYNGTTSHWSGHAGIVYVARKEAEEFSSIEGNTNDKGGREGYIVAIHKHKVDFTLKDKKTQRRLRGFIYPKGLGDVDD